MWCMKRHILHVRDLVPLRGAMAARCTTAGSRVTSTLHCNNVHCNAGMGKMAAGE